MNNMKVATLTSSPLARKGTDNMKIATLTSSLLARKGTDNMKIATLTSSLLARKGTAVPSAFAPTAMPAMPPMPPAPTPSAPPAVAARKTEAAAGGAVARPNRNGTGRYLDQVVPYGSDDMGRHVGVSWRRGPSIRRRIVHELAPDLDQILQRHRQRPMLDLLAVFTKLEFLAAMSHDLRTPLNAIIGLSEIINRETFGPGSAKYRDYAGDIHESGRHMLDLINDILGSLQGRIREG